MKLGFNLLLWTTHVTPEHWPILEKLEATGYDGVEIPVFEGEVKHYAELGRHLADLGLASTAIGVLPSGKSAISADKAERRAALDHIRWLVDCTAAPDLKEGDWLDIPFDLPAASQGCELSQYELLTTLGDRFKFVA